MRDIVKTPIVIFALNAGSEEHEAGILKANGFNARKPLDGVHKGQHELAWLVCIHNTRDRQAIITLAKQYNQESILFSGVDRVCTLYYIADKRADQVGVLTDVPESFAKKQESYTYDKQANKYWVCL